MADKGCKSATCNSPEMDSLSKTARDLFDFKKKNYMIITSKDPQGYYSYPKYIKNSLIFAPDSFFKSIIL